MTPAPLSQTFWYGISCNKKSWLVHRNHQLLIKILNSATQSKKKQNWKLSTKNNLLYPTESWPSDQIPYTKINQSKPYKTNLTTIIIEKNDKCRCQIHEYWNTKIRKISYQNKFAAKSTWIFTHISIVLICCIKLPNDVSVI